MSSASRISIVIPTYRRPDALRQCLSALVAAAERIESGRVDVVVSDDDPAGGAREVVGQHPDFIRWVQGPGRGPAANRNCGARHAQGEVLVFLDDDCLPDSNLLAAYADAVREHPLVDIFEGKIVPQGKLRYAYESCPVNLTGGALWSANMAVRRGWFEAMGGFDEQYPFAAMEDVDFRYRCQKAEKTMLFCPQAIVGHPVEVRRGSQLHSRHRYSVLIYAEKHPEQIARLRATYSPLTLLRLVKQRIFQRSLLQPLGSYGALAQELYSTYLVCRILRDPAGIARKRKRLGAALAAPGERAV